MIDNIFELYNQPSNGTADGIEIIVNMAKKQEIDPWNIDIVQLTDKYLQQIVEMKQNNLRLTGRTLFFAAFLLRLKSDILEGIDSMENEDELMQEFDGDYDTLERRTSVKLNRKRVVTLKDLIKQLKFYEELDRKRSLKNAHERAKRRVRSYANLTPDDIINLAHEEFIEDGVNRIHNVLFRLFEKEEKVELSELQETGMNKITAYIALLFLSAKENINLVQDEFYSDLYVTMGEDKPNVAEV